MDPSAPSLFLLRRTAAHHALPLRALGLWSAAGVRLHARHSRLFHVGRACFDASVFALLDAHKVGIVLFFLIPGLVPGLATAS